MKKILPFLLFWMSTCWASSATHYVIIHSGVISACSSISVELHAVDADGNIDASYAGMLSITDNGAGGSWALTETGDGNHLSQGALNDSHGTASYSFVALDGGRLYLTYTNDGTSDVTVSASSQFVAPALSDDGTAGPLVYTDTIFLITDVPLTDPDNVPAFGVKTAGTQFDSYITAYGNHASAHAAHAVCGVISSYTGSHTMTFSQTRVNPSSGTVALQVSNGGGFSDMDVSLPLTFSTGTAQIALVYEDVGQIQFTATEGNSIGSSGNFVVKPYDLVVTVDDLTPITTADNTATAFVKAGAPFTVRVSSKSANGNITPNFGQESTPETITVYSSAIVSPSDGRNGSNNDGILSGGASFVVDPTSASTGVFVNSSVSFDEVGIIALTAKVTDNDYLGAGSVESLSAVSVGRFTPDHYLVVSNNTPSIATNCHTSGTTGFSYIGKPFEFYTAPTITVTAQSVGNTTTQNAAGDYWKLADDLGGTMSVSSTITNLGVSLENTTTSTAKIPMDGSTAAPGTTVAAVLGQAEYQFSLNSTFRFAPITTAGVYISAFSPDMALTYSLTDSDGVTGSESSYSFGTTTTDGGIAFDQGKSVRHGRLHLKNAAGSELVPLYMPMVVEYYDGNSFITNTDDVCTQYTALPTLSNPIPTNLPSYTVTNIVSGSGSDSGYFTSGLRLLKFTLDANQTPMGGTMDVLLDTSTVPWLGYPWATGRLNPMAQASFGIYAGEKPVIFKEESHTVPSYYE
jgi:MSHA biogenesis protein MshQ